MKEDVPWLCYIHKKCCFRYYESVKAAGCIHSWYSTVNYQIMRRFGKTLATPNYIFLLQLVKTKVEGCILGSLYENGGRSSSAFLCFVLFFSFNLRVLPIGDRLLIVVRFSLFIFMGNYVKDDLFRSPGNGMDLPLPLPLINLAKLSVQVQVITLLLHRTWTKVVTIYNVKASCRTWYKRGSNLRTLATLLSLDRQVSKFNITH